MAQKGFAKVISTHEGDVLVEKTNEDNGKRLGLKITCLTDSGFLVSVEPKFSDVRARDAHYRSINTDVAKKFISNYGKAI